MLQFFKKGSILRSFILTLLLLTLLHSDIKITKDTQYQNITPSLFYLICKNKCDIRTIMKKSTLFQPIHTKRLLLGYLTNKTLWIHFVITNKSDETVERYLELNYPVQEELALYDIAGQKSYPRFHAFTPYFKLHFQPHQTREFFLYSRNKNGATIIELNLYDPKLFHKRNFHLHTATMLFLGALGALFFYNLFLLFATKDISYLYYIVMMVGFAFLALYINGFFTAYFDTFVLSRKILYTILLLIALTMILFTKTFLDLAKKFPKLNKLLNVVVAALILFYFLELADLLPIAIQRVAYLSLFLALILIGLYALFQGVKEALYYVLGWILLFISFTLLALRQLGVFDLYDTLPYTTYIGVFGEGILFSMALSARINTLKKEKERASTKLLEKTKLQKDRLEAYAAMKTKELQKTLQEKEILLKELHHRVKNNLQIIISLLRLQADRYDGHSELSFLLLESESRIRAIFHVHEMLYQSNNLLSIDTQEYFQTLVAQIQQAYRSDNVSIQIEAHGALEMEKAIYCGLILNELITNAFKYAFTPNQKGTIKILFQKETKSYRLVVKDDGRGFDPQKARKESLGLKLVHTLVTNQLKGKVTIEHHKGMCFFITFPS